MKQKFAYLILALSLCGAMLTSCGQDDESLMQQEEKIIAYLTKQSLDYTIEGGTYKVVLAEGDQSRRAERGDSLSFNYAGMIFDSDPSGLFTTSWEWLVDTSTGLNTEYWSFEPARVRLGDGTIIKGIENALNNCCEGDSLQLFIPSPLGYGEEEVGNVSKNTALMFLVKVESIY
ncbi:MAG: FKBP-type peptidyl-prolyl cis-trans isomerase [Tidjanibacter sp.]|nr:FKBP-type peptidyl-prolyl cis-trans isomerase [Tidjanibacter sp.]